jgi:thioredoxin 1
VRHLSPRSVFAWTLTACLLGLASAGARSADLPYDEHANAAALIVEAERAAGSSHRDVLLVFGANWCTDCRVLDATLHGAGAAAISEKYVVVKIDVGDYDKNLDLAKRYQIPLRQGIPAAAVVSGEDKLLYVTKQGELADARHMGDQAIVGLLERASADSHRSER